MRTDSRFGVLDLDLFHALLTPAIQAQYDQVAGAERAGIRRCVESGRSEAECLTEGVGKSFMNMIGGFLPPGLTPPAIVGVRVVGTYPGPGKFALTFSNESVTLTCADLEAQTLPYTATMTPGGLRT